MAGVDPNASRCLHAKPYVEYQPETQLLPLCSVKVFLRPNNSHFQPISVLAREARVFCIFAPILRLQNLNQAKSPI